MMRRNSNFKGVKTSVFYSINVYHGFFLQAGQTIVDIGPSGFKADGISGYRPNSYLFRLCIHMT